MPGGLKIESIELLLLTAAVVAILARKARLPYTVGLLLAGIGLAFLPVRPGLELTRELLFNTLLPPLVFEAAFHIPWSELRRDLASVTTLATVGVLLSAAATSTGMHYLAHWPWKPALLFSTLIAATDPVSVIATFREAGVTGRVRLLVEAESLFNDGTAAVFFGLALAFAAGGPMSVGGTCLAFLWTVAGGLACGVLAAAGVLLLAGHTQDHLVEITFTTVAAYGSFLVAEHFHASGVLAALSAGLVLGNTGSLGAISDRGRDAVIAFWEYLAFVANSLIFLLLGLREAHQSFRPFAGQIALAILLVLAGRALAVYPCCALFARTRRRIERAQQHTLFWGGLRGALALALALGLPATISHREAIVAVAFAVVAWSVVVHGLTMSPLLRRLGQIAPRTAQRRPDEK